MDSMPEIAQIMRRSAGARRGAGRAARGSQRLAGLHATAMGPGTVLGHWIFTDMLPLLRGRLTLSFSLLVFCDMHLTSIAELACCCTSSCAREFFVPGLSLQGAVPSNLMRPTDGGF